MRVLVADDDRTSRTLLESMLGKWGFDTVVVADGDEAFAELTAEEPPRLAVLDWMMPIMNGVEVCRKLRARGGSRPLYIVLLTALGRKDDVVTGLGAGADDYVTKPFDSEELRARLDIGRRVVELQTTLAKRVTDLEDALGHIKTLQGILPICMHCHKIRTDEASWQRIEAYIEDHSTAQFSHSLCPECLAQHYPSRLPNRKG